MDDSRPLPRIRIASPCPMPWSTMRGDQRVRFCERCQHSVYNLSAMTRTEVSALLDAHRANMCVRFYERADRTVVTADCAPSTRLERLRSWIRTPAFRTRALLPLFWTVGACITLVSLVTLFGEHVRGAFRDSTSAIGVQEAVPTYQLSAKPYKMGFMAFDGDNSSAY